MNALYSARPMRKCEPLGVYDGEILTVPEYDSARRPLAKDYAFETGILHTEGADVRLMVVPHLRSDGAGVDYRRHPLALLNEPPPGTTSNVVVQQVTVDPSSMRGPGPSSAIEPLVCLVAFTARAIRAGEELTLHYGGKYQDRRDYPVGNASSVRCPKDLSQLFPAGVPWEAIAMIESDMLPEADSGSDEEWKPGMN